MKDGILMKCGLLMKSGLLMKTDILMKGGILMKCFLLMKSNSLMKSGFCFLFLFLGNFLNSCGCSTAKSKTSLQETIFLPTYRYRAWVPTIPDHS